MPVGSVTGVPWTAPTLRRALISPRIAGLREHRGKIVGPAVWQPVVDRLPWETCRMVLADPARTLWRPTQRYLLSGGILVDHLGRKMFARPAAGHRRCYVTDRDNLGPGLRIDADALETYVMDFVKELAADRVGKVDLTPAPASGRDEIGAMEDELLGMAKEMAAGGMSFAEWRIFRKPLQERLDASRSALKPIERPLDITDVLARWDSLSVNDLRDVVAKMLRRVVVSPALPGRNTFDNRRVSIEIRIGEQAVPMPSR